MKTMISITVMIDGDNCGNVCKTINRDVVIGESDIISFGTQFGTAIKDSNVVHDDDFEIKKCKFKLNVKTTLAGGNWFKNNDEVFEALSKKGWKK